MKDIYKENMDKIIKQIQRSGIKNMMDYIEFEYFEDILLISFYKPSILSYSIHNRTKHKLIRQLMFENYNSKYTQNCYARLLRFGKKDYLNYITYIAYYDKYICDNCNNSLKGDRMKCVKCFEVDLCYDCYKKINKRCPDCKTQRIFKYNKNNIFPRVSKITI
jgi:hypothetical protein